MDVGDRMINEKEFFENLTKEKGVGLSKLYECAYLRNVYKLQHRMIHEFAWFVEQVVFSGKHEFEKYQFDWISDTALETWIEKFHEYCKEEYKEGD